jgi:hypothetical protein
MIEDEAGCASKYLSTRLTDAHHMRYESLRPITAGFGKGSSLLLAHKRPTLSSRLEVSDLQGPSSSS